MQGVPRYKTRPRRTLIVGGYGHVGFQIAARLCEAGQGVVRLAGRSAPKLREASERLGCEQSVLDLTLPKTWKQALEGVDCVISCVDQADVGFVRAVLERGLIYLDITADDGFFLKVERLGDIARANGGRAILSVGLAPGLSNLMVKSATEGMEIIKSARIGILLGLGDAHGPAAIDWTLQNFREVQPGARQQIAFGDPPQIFPAIPFNFADQHVLQRTLGISNVQTLLTFDRPFMSRVMFSLLRRAASNATMRWLFKRVSPYLRIGSDRAALTVEVTGEKHGRPVRQRMTLEGRQEARITALMAALTTEWALQNDMPAGIHHIEQLATLEMLGFRVFQSTAGNPNETESGAAAGQGQLSADGAVKQIKIRFSSIETE